MAPLSGRAATILSHSGTELKTFFTMAAGARYAGAMLLLFAAGLATPSLPPSAPPPWAHRPVMPVVQARATVRILSGVTLRLGHASPVEGQRLRVTHVTTADGVQPARLVEFE
jgi:hypothetical protein